MRYKLPSTQLIQTLEPRGRGQHQQTTVLATPLISNSTFPSAVQWWEEWQLRILVLGSLIVQLYLAWIAPFRKVTNLWSLYRLLIWLAYLGGDALAIYALATLFNRQKTVQCSSSHLDGSYGLEVLWAPILLMHLGGRMTISAYNIEDNELWGRHIGVAVSQVAVTIYVFCRSWSPLADKRLLAAAIMLFILGVFRCLEKPYALKRASFNNLVKSFRPAPVTGATSREVELEQYIQEAMVFFEHNKDKDPPILDEDGRKPHIRHLSNPDRLFVDSADAYPNRLKNLRSFWLLDHETAYTALLSGQSKTFDLSYTKLWQFSDENRRGNFLGNQFSIMLHLTTITLPIASIVLFHISHKEAYRGSDIKVTYILLYLTYCSDILTMPGRLIFQPWYDKVSQYSLIEAFSLNKRHKILFTIAKLLQCGDRLVQTYIKQARWDSSKDITSLVRGHVRDGWMNYIRDVESYWKFCSSRGHWTIEEMEKVQGSSEGGCMLIRSIDKPLDESIILWHVATDFCFYHRDAPPDSPCARLCRQISNYMMHLLFANPEMLLPGSRRALINIAYSQLEALLQQGGGDVDVSSSSSSLDVKGLTQRIIEKVESGDGCGGHLSAETTQCFIHGAWDLAQELMKLGDEKRIWDVIRGVWIEMLCFSAGRCRGYLLARSLGSGGEHLSVVSLLISHAGLETLAERHQRMPLRLPKHERVETAKQKIQAEAAAAAAVEVTVLPTYCG